MTQKQAQKVLDELQGVRPGELNGEAKRLFEAIMKIADERDELKEKIKNKITEYKARKAKCNDIESEIRLDVKIKAYEELLEK